MKVGGTICRVSSHPNLAKIVLIANPDSYVIGVEKS